MKTFRVVCSTDTSKAHKNTIVDFSSATEKSEYTHYHMKKMRQFSTPNAKVILSHVMLHDDNGKVDIAFTDEVKYKITPQDEQTLQQYSKEIKLAYQRFKHRNLESTVELTPENRAFVYDFVDPRTMDVNSIEQEKIRTRLAESQRLQQARQAQQPVWNTRRPLYMTGYRHSGD